MAEVYGEKPKKFTREWWPYFWMYYRWHTIIVVVAIIGIAIGVYQKATEVKYDLDIVYRSQSLYIGENGEKELIDTLVPFMEDANDDGEVHLFFNQINLSSDPQQEFANVDIRMKHDVEFVNPTYFLYIYDSAEIDMVEVSYRLGDMFMPADMWADSIEGKDVRSSEDGTVYGVSLKDSKIMADCGIDGDNMYVFVRSDAIGKENNHIAKENAMKLANELIK